MWKGDCTATLEPWALLFVARLTLAACGEETAAVCTAKTAQAKMMELTNRTTELATSDPAKLEHLSGKAAELQ